ncbi:Bax inhibitor-1/YccA family protein [Gemmatimonas sp.]|uniref:Bax inhibitor-1/YccA family protein n=1 Tax=Gemmatimonas sp. TaxID=1962908 RepID=UPI00391FBB94
MRTNNPVLSRFADTARETFGLVSPGAMTVAGTAGKAMLLLAVVVFSAAITWQQVAGGRPELVMPAMLVGGLGGFVFALVTSFRPQWAPWTAPIYASLEGIFLGAISALYNTRFAGLPQQAVLLTVGVAAGVLVLYRLRVLRATAGFKRMMLGAVIGIGLFYLGSFLLSLFGVQVGYFTSTSWLAIGVNVAIAGVAALNLVLDFDRIEEGARMGAPKAMEWFAAFGLMVTLIWLYLELLRLLSRLQGRRD